MKYLIILLVLLSSCSEVSTYTEEQQLRKTTLEILQAPKDTVVITTTNLDNDFPVYYQLVDDKVVEKYVKSTNSNMVRIQLGDLFATIAIIFAVGMLLGAIAATD